MKGLLVASCSLLVGCAAASRDAPGDDDATPDDAAPGPDATGDDAPPPDNDMRRGWIDLGAPPGASSGDAQSPALAVWNGAPVVAYSADQHVRVYAYEGNSAWAAVGTPLRHSADANAVTYDPTPVASADGLGVVWPEWSAGSMTSPVRRREGNAWVAPPGAAALGAAGALSFLPQSSAAVDADGSMWITYAETGQLNDPMRVHVVSLLGANVYQRGQNITATGTNTGAIAPQLAIGGGAQYLAWMESGVRLAKRNTTTGSWDAFGGSPIIVGGRAASSQFDPQLSIDSTGRPILAFTSNGPENGIYVARWNGAAWTYWAEALQATPGTVMGASSHPYLRDLVAAGADAAYVTWSEADASGVEGIYVYRCTPAGCAPVGRGRLDAMPGMTPGASPKLAVDQALRPLVTWTEDDAHGNAQVRVWRYQGDPDSP